MTVATCEAAVIAYRMTPVELEALAEELMQDELCLEADAYIAAMEHFPAYTATPKTGMSMPCLTATTMPDSCPSNVALCGDGACTAPVLMETIMTTTHTTPIE